METKAPAEDQWDKLRGIGGLCLFVLFAVAMVLISIYTPVGEYFKMDFIRKVAKDIYPWGPAVIVACGIVGPIFFLPRWPIAYVSGLLYGVIFGAILANTASLLGAILQFYLARNLLAPLSDRLRKRYNFLSRQIKSEKVFLGLFFSRAFPLSNFVATNLTCGALRVPVSIYALASFLGMIPSTVMYASFGKLLKKQDFVNYALAVVMMLVVALGTLMARRYFIRRSADDGGAQEKDEGGSLKSE